MKNLLKSIKDVKEKKVKPSIEELLLEIKNMINSLIHVEELTVTENGTYQEHGKSYSPVHVNVETHTSSKLIDFLEGDADFSLTAEDLDGLSQLRNKAFADTKKLVRVELPFGIIEIPSYCFSTSGIKILDLPSSVEVIGTNAFYSTALDTVICRAVNPPVPFGGMFFYNTPRVIYVPDDSVEQYKTAEYWSYYSDFIKPLSNYNARM